MHIIFFFALYIFDRVVGEKYWCITSMWISTIALFSAHAHTQEEKKNRKLSHPKKMSESINKINDPIERKAEQKSHHHLAFHFCIQTIYGITKELKSNDQIVCQRQQWLGTFSVPYLLLLLCSQEKPIFLLCKTIDSIGSFLRFCEHFSSSTWSSQKSLLFKLTWCRQNQTAFYQLINGFFFFLALLCQSHTWSTIDPTFYLIAAYKFCHWQKSAIPSIKQGTWKKKGYCISRSRQNKLCAALHVLSIIAMWPNGFSASCSTETTRWNKTNTLKTKFVRLPSCFASIYSNKYCVSSLQSSKKGYIGRSNWVAFLLRRYFARK